LDRPSSASEQRQVAPPKFKQRNQAGAVKKLFTQAACAAGIIKRKAGIVCPDMVAKSRWAKAAHEESFETPAKRGRKAGSVTVTDEAIKAALSPHTSESSRFYCVRARACRPETPVSRRWQAKPT